MLEPHVLYLLNLAIRWNYGAHIYYLLANCTNLLFFSYINVSGGFSHWFKTVKEKFEKRDFQCAARVLVSVLARLFAFFRGLQFESWRGQNNNSPSSVAEQNTNIHSPTLEAVKDENCVLPCIRRLQRLEKVFEELSNRPARIPLEKDKILMESLDRIKSVEVELEKTKRVCSILLCIAI